MTGTNIEKINMQSTCGVKAFPWEIAVTVLAFVGGYFCFFSAIGMTAAWYAVFFGISSAVCFGLFAKKKHGKLFVLGACGIVSIVLTVVQIIPFAGSFVGAFNAFVATANGNLYYGFPSINVTLSPNAYSDFALCAVVAIWAGVLTILVQKNRAVFFSVTTVYLLLLLLLGIFPSPVAAIALLAAIPVKCVAVNGYPLKSALAFSLAFVVVLAAAGGSFAFSGSETVAGVRRGVAEAAERVLYGGDTLPQGRLDRADELYKNPDTVRLEVDLTGNLTSLYLKAFVGSDFDGVRWKENDKNDYVTAENQGLLDYVATGGIPFMQYARYRDLLGNTSRYTVTVKNKSANRKYAYTPYSLCSGAKGSYYDFNLRRSALAPNRYSFEVFGNDASSERLIQASWVSVSEGRTPEISQYLRYDAEYHRFVYEEYLSLGEGVREKIESAFSGVGSTSVFGVSRLIRLYYNENFVNSDRIDVPEGDFLSAFFGGKINKSNAVYFATAATLVFRAYGIPARYVEGYRVTGKGGGAGYTVGVTGRDSHAWTEVYFDGVGWLPVDVTFYSEADLIEPTPGGDPSDGDDDNKDPVIPEPEPEPEPEPPEKKPDWVEEHIPAKNRTLFYALRALIPVLSFVLFVLVGTVVTIVRRELVFARKNKRLCGDGEAFGRAAMYILDSDFSKFGGFSEEEANRLGIPKENTDRFIHLVERTVYGGYALNVSEREYVLRYIDIASEAVARSKGKLFSFYCKYLKCVGIGGVSE